MTNSGADNRAIRSLRRIRPVFLTVIFFAIIAQIVALSPRSLEQPQSKGTQLRPVDLVTSDEAVLASGIPKNRIADYTVDGFRYSSVQGTERQWHMIATRAFLYNEEKLVHSVNIHAQFFDAEGKITLVTGKEAKYYMNDRNVEVFGDVVTTFPDGFVIRSDYMHYFGAEHRIEVPEKFEVTGEGAAGKENEYIAFSSKGLTYHMADQKALLPKDVRVTLITRQKVKNNRTTVVSDRAEIDRANRIADFTMSEKRPAESRFVQINEPTLFARSRRARMDYGHSGHTLNYLIALEDVFLRERPDGEENEDSVRYATAGRADFDNRNNTVVLSEYPQVYQDSDTMTGDVITLHRDSDVVEVEHSNAYSEGALSKKSSKSSSK